MREDLSANGTAKQTDWNAVDWRQAEKTVRNLRQRIFRATQEGNLKKVRSLQKLMLKSYSNRLVSVRRVTQVSTGRNTPGVDKPVVIDRCVQAMVKNALEPSWEARFEGSSYGFRPGRSSHDAIEKIYGLARPNKTKKWVLDADIKGAFDHIGHEHLLKAIGRVPGRELIKQWLRAGYMCQ
jgi:RNA-directed DNA polymerase